MKERHGHGREAAAQGQVAELQSILSPLMEKARAVEMTMILH